MAVGVRPLDVLWEAVVVLHDAATKQTETGHLRVRERELRPQVAGDLLVHRALACLRVAHDLHFLATERAPLDA